MRRRDFILLVGGAVVAGSPVVARAQRPAVQFIGFLGAGLPNERVQSVEAFRQGLKEAGYVDGKDVAIEYRWGEGSYERLRSLAKELVSRQVAVIVATGGAASAAAAKAATSSIPIVFTIGGDPVRLGLVKSLSRPGGNATGITNLGMSLEAKRFELLAELLPKTSTIVYLVNPDSPYTEEFVKSAQAAVGSLGKRLHVLKAGNERDLDTAFKTLRKIGAPALAVAPDPFFMVRRVQIVALAALHAIPCIYSLREFSAAGGLMSYGSDPRDMYRQAGVYTGRVLKGARPADLPVLQADKFELVLNLKTAKKLGLAISRDFLARVDEVIE